MVESRDVFITGGTGYMGQRLVPLLLERGHRVTAVSRPGSVRKIPTGCVPVIGDVLDRRTWQQHLRRGDTFVHLVGVAHPSPAKAREFVEIDLKSAVEAVAAAKEMGVRHLVYVSVAQPAPAMKAYVAVRAQCESAIREADLNATVLRPWYVLGPGHWWPVVLLPFYKIAELLPSAAEGARRLGLVSLREMVAALVYAVEHPANGFRVMTVPEIRGGGGTG